MLSFTKSRSGPKTGRLRNPGFDIELVLEPVDKWVK